MKQQFTVFKTPEILAPVGSKEAFFAAINSGADAIYLGGKVFGARAYANNFDINELDEIVETAHLRGVKVYYTLNTIIKDVEMNQLIEELTCLSVIPFDAFIIQDMGVYQIIKEQFSFLTLHSSTQMNLHNLYDVNQMKALGFERVVLARETSLEDISKIKENVDIEIETFVHGALCYSYSGQCLMSSIYGKRSGNRGKCAQPCRMAYTFEDESVYLLSPKDQMTLEILPELIKVGIDSFKIEGRMKNADYVGFTTLLYKYYSRLAITLLQENRIKEYSVKEEDILKLKALYNRGGFTKGYYNKHNGKEMISYTHGKHFGIKVGSGYKGNQSFVCQIEENIRQGDLLEFHPTHGLLVDENVLTFHAEENIPIGEKQFTMIYNDRQERKTIKDYPVDAFDIHRLKSVELIKQLNIESGELKPIAIQGEVVAKLNQEFELTLTYDEHKVVLIGDIVQKASNKPVEEERILKQLSKTGGTEFVFEHIEFNMDQDIFIPMSGLNQLKRDGLEQLKVKILQKYSMLRNHTDHQLKDLLVKNKNLAIINTDFSMNDESLKKAKKQKLNGTYSCVLRNLEHIEAIVEHNNEKGLKIGRIYIDVNDFTVQEINDSLKQLKQLDLEVYIAFPHVILDSKMNRWIEKLKALDRTGYEGYLLRSIGQKMLLIDFGKQDIIDIKKMIAFDYNLNIFNKKSLQFYNGLGVDTVHLSLELNEAGLKDLCNKTSELTEIMVYGAYPLMQSSNCIYKTMKGCQDILSGHQFVIKDRKGENLRVNTHCEMCYNTIYNGKRTYLLDVCHEIKSLKRLEFVDETKNEILKLLRQEDNGFQPEYLTRGHFKRGVK